MFSRGIKWLFRGMELLSIGITPMVGWELIEILDLRGRSRNRNKTGDLTKHWGCAGSKISSGGIRMFQGLLDGFPQSQSNVGIELRAALAGCL